MDYQRDIESCNMESYNDDRLDSEKLDCHDFTSVKSRNDNKIDSNLIHNLDSEVVRVYFVVIARLA